MSSGRAFRLTLFTNRPGLAAAADGAGVDRIGPDLERLGKQERQGGMNRWISDHTEGELPGVFAALARARRFVRCNPPHPGLAAEIERLLAQGAQVVMLPHFHHVDEARRFVGAIGGRARSVLLVETVRAASRVAELCRLEGLDEIHFGLNDLSLDLGWGNQFAVLCSSLLEDACAVVRESGLPFAVGGIGRALDRSLPVRSELVYAQYPRLGASGALLSRVFFAGLPEERIAAEVAAARARLDHWARQDTASLDRARDELRALAAAGGHGRPA